MSNLAKVVAQLRQQRDQVQKQVEQLNEALAALGNMDGSRRRGRTSQASGTKRRIISAEARKSIAAGQRARWAKWRAKRRTTRPAVRAVPTIVRRTVK